MKATSVSLTGSALWWPAELLPYLDHQDPVSLMIMCLSSPWTITQVFSTFYVPRSPLPAYMLALGERSIYCPTIRITSLCSAVLTPTIVFSNVTSSRTHTSSQSLLPSPSSSASTSTPGFLHLCSAPSYPCFTSRPHTCNTALRAHHDPVYLSPCLVPSLHLSLPLSLSLFGASLGSVVILAKRTYILSYIRAPAVHLSLSCSSGLARARASRSGRVAPCAVLYYPPPSCMMHVSALNPRNTQASWCLPSGHPGLSLSYIDPTWSGRPYGLPTN
ncbi:hypothetical protein BD413DRAFT_174486 [Trametes elegans]|nr:hypothetical protein BD413DRAFT_174486 [Trametes elegans]